MLRDVEVAVLGPIEVRLGGRAVDLGTPKQRALVAALALSRGRAVSVDTIVDLLWRDSPPPGVTATLQAYISGLRRVIEPERERRAPATVLVTVAPGYALRADADHLDAQVFERTVSEQHHRLQTPRLLSEADLAEAVAALDAALGLWRGTAYAELEGADAAVAERARLEELRLVALEDRAVAELTLGHHATVAAELEAMTREHPLRERLWGLRALALTRAGRQADALEVLRTVREVLDDELGIEPGVELRDLQTAVLRQDPALDWVAPAAGAETPVVPQPRRSEPAPPEPVAPWPMVGRDAELDQLVAALNTAAAGTPSYAVVTGEPGIGKSRLTAELAALAGAQGAQVSVGQCSQDEGAPPLWPWMSVLESLGLERPGPLEPDDEGGRFRSWDLIARGVRAAALDRPLVVILEDLHWADPSTLRVLRLLVESASRERLLVVATWRSHPEPTGALADVAETLARQHATRLPLSGLGADSVAEVFEGVAHNRPSGAQARAIKERTDGNPFFLVEYARLAGEHADLDQLVSDADPPTGVREVLTRRLARLPEATVTALRTAAVIGRAFDAATLAAAAGVDPEELLDVVEPAEAAGLVREDGVDRFLFSHALVADTLVLGLSASRQARVHSRIAVALSGSRGRETEEARHWLASGPAYAAQGWRSAVTAAAVARRVFAHEEVAELLRAALGAMDHDPGATPRERYDVLLDLIDAYRWSAMWPELTASVEEAVVVAQALGDPELVATAAIATTQGALWQSAGHGQVHTRIVEALRACLRDLPPEDNALRCRALLGLGNELYYGAPFGEREALVDAAVAMARRLEDRELLLDACQIAFVSLWRAGNAPQRLALADEALALARECGSERSFAVSATLRAVVLGELGRPAEMWPAIELARAEDERLRLPYGLMVLDSLALPWHAMAGRFEECDALVERIRHLDSQITLEQSEDATAGALIALSIWRGTSAETAGLLMAMEGGPFPIAATVVAFLWRGGAEEEARAYARDHEVRLDTDDWFSLLAWCNAAEVALHCGDPELGARVLERLAPLAGRSCGAGSGNASGPVDAFLALAAASMGRLDEAGRHAVEALRLCEEWDIPLVARWFGDQRDRYHF
ncbi:putative Transcriptional activator domain [metagenome]|uniref:Putative Transcriptional activator domain n=1 Tax=metagenome TaxID=256318 RepID=A0A2P2C1Z4_9ZZZZ